MYILTVIIPVYKCEKYIERCVKSLMEQSLDKIQYIFVDDCSPDNSIKKIESIIEQYPTRKKDVLIILNDTNLGPSATRNRGISYAKGEYLAFCDSDDFVEENMYEILYNVSQGKDIVFCDINIISDSGNSHVYRTYSEYYLDKNSFIKSFINSKWTPIYNCLIKRELITQYEIELPEHIKYCEDFHFMIRSIFYAKDIMKINKPLYNYTQDNDNSIMHDLSPYLGKDDIKCYLEIIDFFTHENCIEYYQKEMSWRVLGAFHFDMFNPKKHKKIINIYPISHQYILSHPFYLKRQKQLMWLLTHHCRWLVLIFIYARKLLGRK